ncbi:hypothetical protein LTS18_014896, partial [Coniosporium uncinatum]
DPIEWFEERVASGNASTQSLTIYVQSLLHKYNSLGGSERDEYICRRGASKALAWLGSSAHMSFDALIERSWPSDFINAFVRALIIEHRQDVLQVWLFATTSTTRTLDGSNRDNAATNLRKWKSRILKAYLLAELPSGRLDESLKVFLRALSLSTGEDRLLQNPHASAAGFILTMIKMPHLRLVASSLYESFLNTVPQWSDEPLLWQGLLSAHHPQTPTTSHGLKYLKSINSTVDTWQSGTKSKRHAQVELCLALARLFLAKDSVEDATWVMDLARSGFPEELGLTVDQETTEESRPSMINEKEMANLRELDALCLG